MSEAEIRARLGSVFRGELQDHVRLIEQNLLALERDAGTGAEAALYSTLFRSAHSLKGAARVVQAYSIEAACHRLEEILQSLRDGRLSADRDLFQFLLAVVDGIAQSGPSIDASPNTPSALDGLLPKLIAVAERGGASASAEAEVVGSQLPPALVQPRSDGFVRVPTSKLDALLAQSEQLLVSRRRADQQDVAFEQLLEQTRPLQAQLQDLERMVAQALAGDRAGHVVTETASSVWDCRTRSAKRALADHQVDLQGLSDALRALTQGVASDRRALDQAAEALDDEVRRVRMLPFAGVCDGFDRLARDLTDDGVKQVEIIIEGGEVELDRSVLEGLRDPLVHLVRNAIDHGIEPAEVRRQAGKPAAGRIVVKAVLRGMRVEVEVADDGYGIDLDAVRAEADRRGLGQMAATNTLLDHIFRAGFTTSARASAVSGRGLGLDVVKSQVEAMRGGVEVFTEKGRGSQFKLTLPLTLTSIRGLLVVAGGSVFALDTANVRKLLRVPRSDIREVEGRAMIVGEGPPLALASLATLLGLPTSGAEAERDKVHVVVLAVGGSEAALAVEELLSEQELLVRNLGSRLKRVRYVAGGTVLPTGRIALILHASDVVQAALAGTDRGLLMPKTPAGTRAARKRLVVADDSVTTRTLMKSILEGAGYEVLVAADGAEAWRMVQDKGADLVVTDVEMPRMDGFELTEAIRGSALFREVPVILVTALESEADKTRGLRVGASAYLLKSAFDQRDLLHSVAQFL